MEIITSNVYNLALRIAQIWDKMWETLLGSNGEKTV